MMSNWRSSFQCCGNIEDLAMPYVLLQLVMLFWGVLSKNCGDKFTCINFWTDYLKKSKAKLIGFQQKFCDLPTNLSRTSQNSLDITLDIKDAASELISATLSYAKEARRLRTHIFQEKFEFTSEPQSELYSDAVRTSWTTGQRVMT